MGKGDGHRCKPLPVCGGCQNRDILRIERWRKLCPGEGNRQLSKGTSRERKGTGLRGLRILAGAHAVVRGPGNIIRKKE